MAVLGRSPRQIIGVLLVFLFAAVQPAHAQHEITVRFLDFKSGKPIKNFYLTVEAWSGHWERGIVTEHTAIIWEKYSRDRYGNVTVHLPPRQSGDATVVFSATTRADRDGRAVIHLPEVLPERIRISSSPVEVSASVHDFSVAEVLKSGALVPYGEDEATSSLQKLSPKSGEIVIFAKKRTVWDRMRQEIP